MHTVKDVKGFSRFTNTRRIKYAYLSAKLQSITGKLQSIWQFPSTPKRWSWEYLVRGPRAVEKNYCLLFSSKFADKFKRFTSLKSAISNHTHYIKYCMAAYSLFCWHLSNFNGFKKLHISSNSFWSSTRGSMTRTKAVFSPAELHEFMAEKLLSLCIGKTHWIVVVIIIVRIIISSSIIIIIFFFFFFFIFIIIVSFIINPNHYLLLPESLIARKHPTHDICSFNRSHNSLTKTLDCTAFAKIVVLEPTLQMSNGTKLKYILIFYHIKSACFFAKISPPKKNPLKNTAFLALSSIHPSSSLSSPSSPCLHHLRLPLACPGDIPVTTPGRPPAPRAEAVSPWSRVRGPGVQEKSWLFHDGIIMSWYNEIITNIITGWVGFPLDTS